MCQRIPPQAFGGGTDFVMAGGMFAGTDEAAGKVAELTLTLTLVLALTRTLTLALTLPR